MAFRIKGSLIIAVILASGLAAWMYNGEMIIGGQSESGVAAIPIAEREAAKSAALFKVRYLPVQSEERSQTILIRGRTKADAIVAVRTETSGVLQQRLVSKGQKVSVGDLVCVLDEGTRKVQLSQAKALLVQATSDYKSALKLKEKGLVADNRLNQQKAALDSAKAGFAVAEQELSRIEVKANAAGIVQDPVAEVGDALTSGATCVTLVDTDPMLFTGQVAELEIGKLAIGMAAKIQLVTGEKIAGKVRYLAAAADAQTRTFQIEIELINGSNIRDGMTAQAGIALAPSKAIRISPSWITLSDEGIIGVRTVGADDIVAFVPVEIIAQSKDGFWITGLEDNARIITLGQEYVRTGEKVEAVVDARKSDISAQTNSVVVNKNTVTQQ